MDRSIRFCPPFVHKFMRLYATVFLVVESMRLIVFRQSNIFLLARLYDFFSGLQVFKISSFVWQVHLVSSEPRLWDLFCCWSLCDLLTTCLSLVYATFLLLLASLCDSFFPGWRSMPFSPNKPGLYNWCILCNLPSTVNATFPSSESMRLIFLVNKSMLFSPKVPELFSSNERERVYQNLHQSSRVSTWYSN